MTGLVEIRGAIDELGNAHKQFQQRHDQRFDALKQENDDLRSRVEELESRQKSVKTTANREQREHMRLFTAWMRRPFDHQTKGALGDFESKLETKDVTVGTGAAGGFAVPEEIAREVGKLELQFSPVRDVVKVVQVGSADYKELVSKRGTTSGWVGETGSRTATATPQLRERALTFGEVYAYPQASEWSLDDIFFNVQDWLAQEIAAEFAQEEGIAVISGNGTSKPTGMLNTSPVSTADFASPERSANAYQLVTSDLTPGGTGIVADALIDLYFTLNAQYRSRSTWIMFVDRRRRAQVEGFAGAIPVATRLDRGSTGFATRAFDFDLGKPAEHFGERFPDRAR
jgi:HK97 family phage major capsid protein